MMPATTLTERRRDKDLSLGECARALGMSPAELSRIERGSELATELQLCNIAAFFGCTSEQVREGLPDKEEIDRISQRTVDMLLAMSACHDDAKKRGIKKGHGGSGEIECPVCKGKLRYSVASINGHMWGSCSTEGCARWMQ